MSSTIILLTVFIGIAEMCGNVHQTGGTISSPSSPVKHTAYVDFLTNLTSDGETEISTIETNSSNENKDLLKHATHKVMDNNGKKVLKYTFTGLENCKAAEDFATATKAANTFITGGTVTCDNKKTPIAE